MVPILTIVAAAVSLMLGIYLGIRTAQSTFPFKGTLPHLAIVAFITVLLTVGDNQFVLVVAGTLLASYCASLWSILWRQKPQKKSTTFGDYSTQRDSMQRVSIGAQYYRTNRSELPFQRKPLYQELPNSWHWVAPGVRRTSSGNIIQIRVNNRNPDEPKERKAAKLTRVK